MLQGTYMMSQGFYSFWMILPFFWGLIGVGIIAVACIRELIQVARGRHNDK